MTLPRGAPAVLAGTVELDPGRRLVWFVANEDGRAFRNFIDFAISPTSAGCRLEIGYYAQNDISVEQREAGSNSQRRSIEESAAAFADRCETLAGVAPRP